MVLSPRTRQRDLLDPGITATFAPPIVTHLLGCLEIAISIPTKKPPVYFSNFLFVRLVIDISCER